MQTTMSSRSSWTMQAQARTVFVPNPNDREDGWVNATVDLTVEARHQRVEENLDGWLMYGETMRAAWAGTPLNWESAKMWRRHSTQRLFPRAQCLPGASEERRLLLRSFRR